MHRTPDRKATVKTLFADWPAFYDADPERLASEEFQVGAWWRPDTERHPMYRLIWLDKTQELVLVKHGMGGHVHLDTDHHFAIESFMVPAGQLQVVGWVPRADPPLPLDTFAQRHFAPVADDEAKVSHVFMAVRAHAYDHPLR